ncbi:MAG: VOC family protein [Chitinophagaceae bacterium]
MPTLNPYLTFSGNCREAMNFYKECLGGELLLTVVGESPVASQVPPSIKDHILHSSLKTDDLEIMATDMQHETITEGNAVHMCLICKTEEETKSLFEKLSAGGKVKQPLHAMFFGLIGTLNDKFGKSWILECDKK